MSTNFYQKWFLFFSICFVSAVQAETALTASDIQKKAIIKLFQENQEMKLKMTDLEKRVRMLEVNKIPPSSTSVQPRPIEKTEKSLTPSKYPFNFTPHILSSVREKPTASAKYVQSYKSTDKIEIYEVSCKGKDVGYWGKTTKGWIFISNPNYGVLSDLNGKPLPYDYSFWCTK
ncbi:hypothetical protein [Sulfurospirillum multivorans]|uniref:SH3b domain-containing protein n=1 Tax=Sulfurospirillum multivorans TaxID=66821 RepID=A0ABX5Z0T1_SULMU|nr:hypothetical protein [Sulfurospirillum multivorans]QEH06495.1 hypothetical protein SMN_1730 [Sulfurospirillum multivorans]